MHNSGYEHTIEAVLTGGSIDNDFHFGKHPHVGLDFGGSGIGSMFRLCPRKLQPWVISSLLELAGVTQLSEVAGLTVIVTWEDDIEHNDFGPVYCSWITRLEHQGRQMVFADAH